jgi:hypothetical protein
MVHKSRQKYFKALHVIKPQWSTLVSELCDLEHEYYMLNVLQHKSLNVSFVTQYLPITAAILIFCFIFLIVTGIVSCLIVFLPVHQM